METENDIKSEPWYQKLVEEHKKESSEKIKIILEKREAYKKRYCEEHNIDEKTFYQLVSKETEEISRRAYDRYRAGTNCGLPYDN